MDAVTLAYLAGVIDSDGSIFLSRTYPRQRRITEDFGLVVVICQTNPAACLLAAEAFGGQVRAVKPDRKTSFKSRQELHRWTLYSRRAEMFVRAIRPYLRIKTQDASIALRFRETFAKGSGNYVITQVGTRNNRGMTVAPETMQLRRKLWEQMRELHQAVGKGHRAPQAIRAL